MISLASLKTHQDSSKNNLEPPAQKLWQCNNLEIVKERPETYRIPEGNREPIGSLQFVGFGNLLELGESFLCKHSVITSTPKVNVECGSSASSFNEITVSRFTKSSFLSGIDHVLMIKQWKNAENVIEQSIQQSVTNFIHQVETSEPEKCKEVNKPLNIATSSFKSHDQDKRKKDNKSKRVKYKNLEEVKSPRVFRANPLPKYLKARKIEINKSKEQKLQSSDKDKENTEKNLSSLNTLPLRTKQRNEMKVQQRRQMELATKKKQEEEKIALLRKQTVHKAQPIRKYKTDPPKVQKRKLTVPQTPMILKRRRIIDAASYNYIDSGI